MSLWWVSLIVALILFIISFRVSKGGANWFATKMIWFWGVCTIICFFVLVYFSFTKADLADKNLNVLEFSTYELGKFLVDRDLRGNMLVLMDQGTSPDSKRGKSLLNGLKKGIGENLKIESVRVMGSKDEKSSRKSLNPLAPMLKAPRWEECEYFIELYPDCAVIVFLTGLPVEFTEMKIWKSKKHPQVVVVNTSPLTLSNALKSGAVLAVMSYDSAKLAEIDKMNGSEEKLKECFKITTKDDLKK